MKFKVGDRITGTVNNRGYSITNTDATMEVVKISGTGKIKVKILSHKTKKSEIGNNYDVDQQYFKKITTMNFKVGDRSPLDPNPKVKEFWKRRRYEEIRHAML